MKKLESPPLSLPVRLLFVVAAASLLVFWRVIPRAYSPHVQVDLLDVGQGSSTLITCYGDSPTSPPIQVLLDAGESDEFYPEAEAKFSTKLAQALKGDRTIEYAILTHPHRDHLFGFRSLISSPIIKIEQFIDNGADSPEQQFEEDLRRQLPGKGVRYRNLSLEPLSSLSLCQVQGQPVDLKFFPLPEDAAKRLNCPNNLNNCSLVTQLRVGEKRVLFMADALTDWEAEADSRFDLRSTLLVAGHHGHQSTSARFLEDVAPRIIALSTGEPERGTTALLGYPEAETIRRILSYLTAVNSSSQKLHESFGQSCNIVLACERRTADESKDARDNGVIKPSCEWIPFSCVSGFLTTAISGTISATVTPQSLSVITEFSPGKNSISR